MTKFATLIAGACVLALTAGSASAQATLKKIQDRGTLACGVSQGLQGFSQRDASGNWSGFDVDFCRALAAAIFNDPSKVTYTPLDTASRFQALESGAIDVLARNSTWTMGREGALLFAGVNYYDGQGFLIRRDAKIDTALELGGKSVCSQTGTTTELNLADYFRANDMTYTLVGVPTVDESVKAYDSKKCDVLTSDVSQLYALRLQLSDPDNHVILPEVISKEPLGPAVRQDDQQWFKTVRWTLNALINAEEMGVKAATVDEAMKSSKPDIRRLMGNEGTFGDQLGLSRDWAARAIRQVGNYGEIYERNVGAASKLGIPRGLNGLWTDGGIQYAPPIR
jgi:general L-amino acid transport system substrate-binding protein